MPGYIPIQWNAFIFSPLTFFISFVPCHISHFSFILYVLCVWYLSMLWIVLYGSFRMNVIACAKLSFRIHLQCFGWRVGIVSSRSRYLYYQCSCFSYPAKEITYTHRMWNYIVIWSCRLNKCLAANNCLIHGRDFICSLCVCVCNCCFCFRCMCSSIGWIDNNLYDLLHFDYVIHNGLISSAFFLRLQGKLK